MPIACCGLKLAWRKKQAEPFFKTFPQIVSKSDFDPITMSTNAR